MIKRLKLLILGLLVVFMSCSSDSGAFSSEAILIKADIGGDSWEATTNTSTLFQVSSLGDQRYDLTAWDNDYKITLAISESNISSCMSSADYNGDNVLLWFYYGLGNDSYVSEHSDELLGNDSIESDVLVKVTSCNDGKISGTFSGTYYKNGDLSGLNTPNIVTITDGVFQNVPFTLYSN